MAAKTKQTKKFNKKHLTHTIESRRKHQTIVKKNQNKQFQLNQKKKLNSIKKNQNQNQKNNQNQNQNSDDDDDDSITEFKPKFDMSLDALLNPRGKQSSQDQASDQQDEDEDEDEENEEDDDLESIVSLEDGSNQKIDFKMLKEKDPEFYKFLEENDKGLLEFNSEDDNDDVEEEEEKDDHDDDDDKMDHDSSSKEKSTVKSNLKNPEDSSSSSILLTKELLRTWQKAILENKSMRALRKILLAFKSAAFSSTHDPGTLPFLIESTSVYNAVINTALRYLPVFLNQILPAKELPNGKFKISTNSKIYASIQRMLKSYFTSLIELVQQVPAQQATRPDDSSTNSTSQNNNNSLLHTSVTQSSKLIPWITGNRKLMKSWIRTLLELWSSSSDQVRLAAILSLRKLALAADYSTTECIMKGVYTTLIKSSKNTTVFTLPLINLMKNSGSNIFLINLDLAYPIVFSYIRQLAIHLRNSMKLKSKEGFQAVYNWQFIHSLDFWSLVLSSACSKETTSSKSNSSALEPLIFPLVQMTIGVIKLVPTTRYYPLRFHCVRILLRLIERTETFIPLTPFLLEPLDSTLFKKNLNSSTTHNNKIKPLDFEYLLKSPKSHENSKVYLDGITEETCFLLLQYHACLAPSLSFPELVLPGLFFLKKFIKSFSSNSHSKNHNIIGQIKILVQKIEAHQDWIKIKRNNISSDSINKNYSFSSLDSNLLIKSPLVMHLTLQAKIRKQKQIALDRSAHNHSVQVD